MNTPLSITATLTTPIAKPQQTQNGFSVEESRDKRLQRQQARFRDRGGIYVPKPRVTLLNILLGGHSPTKEARHSRSRSRSQSPVKVGQKKGKAQGEAHQELNPVSSKTKPRKRKSVVQKEEVTPGGRKKITRASQSRSKKPKPDDLSTSKSATTQSKTRTTRRSTASMATSTAKGKEREELEEDVPKPKRTRTTRKAIEPENSDAETGEEHDSKRKPSAKTRTRKATVKKKPAAKSGGKTVPKTACDSENEEIIGDEGILSEPMKRRGKGSGGRTQGKGSTSSSGKSRGRAKAKTLTKGDVPQGEVEETERELTTTSLNYEKRRAGKANFQSNHGGLSVIAEEEEPVSQMPPTSTSDAEEHPDGMNKAIEKKQSGPDGLPSGGSSSTQALSTGNRKRRQDEVLPPPDDAPARKRAKITTNSEAAGDAKRTTKPQAFTEISSPSRKRKHSETQHEQGQPGDNNKGDSGTKPPAKKRVRAVHTDDSKSRERLKTTSRRKKENSKVAGGSPSRTKTTSDFKNKKPASTLKRKGPPKEVMEQIKRSQPHVEDGEPDELDFLS